jgi:hypothetical protein
MTAGTEEDIQTAVPHGLTESQWISAVLVQAEVWFFLFRLSWRLGKGLIVWAFASLKKPTSTILIPARKRKKTLGVRLKHAGIIRAPLQ